MKLCTAVQEGCGYKDTLSAQRYYATLAKYFIMCITYQPPLVYVYIYIYTHNIYRISESSFVQRMTSSLTQLILQWPFNHVTNRKVLNLVYLCVSLRLMCPIHFLSNHTPRYYSAQYTDSYTCFDIGSSAANLKFCFKYGFIDASVGIKDY